MVLWQMVVEHQREVKNDTFLLQIYVEQITVCTDG